MRKNFSFTSAIIFSLVWCCSLSNSALAGPAKEVVPLQKAEYAELKKAVKSIKSTKQYRKLKPRRMKNKKRRGKEVAVIKDFRALNKAVLSTKKPTPEMMVRFSAQYQRIEQRMNNLTAPGGSSEGRGACMLECADSFPGVGGGAGVNRMLCKAACLVFGE